MWYLADVLKAGGQEEVREADDYHLDPSASNVSGASSRNHIFV